MSKTINKYISKRNNSKDIIYEVHNDVCDVSNLFSEDYKFIVSMADYIFNEYYQDLELSEWNDGEYKKIKNKLLHAYNNLNINNNGNSTN